MAPAHRKAPFRLAMCAHKGAEVAGVCLLLMVQGHVLDLTASHFLTAAQTGATAIALPLGFTFTRYARALVSSRWTMSILVGGCGFVADVFAHPSHYPGAYTEAALTGAGTTALSIAMSHTALGRRLEQLGDAFRTPHDARVSTRSEAASTRR